ncbi:OLC1v1014387C1 [Oldenlandia corymbosa var. corymbosa]|uniref:Acyl carrier protein n=1 Tax=Oldenlandia corymbosa var. corymbosa TaxID=529605 RepID=A0AAV1E409_OLDCO|nr:OLC1v1014387C1 [Oldenlandia corymbosa var. corymbosa]
MASLSTTCVARFGSCLTHGFKNDQGTKIIQGPNVVSISWGKRATASRRFQISCAAKPATVDKVVQIVKKQLALPEESQITPDTKFSELGADSLDTVEIVMGLEEEFDINVEEESSDSITTVQEAADLIEKLVEKKGEA